MKTCGIIVEYNPLHNGHIHHIQEARRVTNCDVLIAVMSPNFVQRGEPAIINKWDRTKLALEMGVDLILELPTVFATQSAKQFAEAAIMTLQLAGVDTIVFGSESNDIKALQTFANYPIMLYDKEESLVRQWSNQFITLSPNDILGVCYLRAIKELAPHMNAIPIQRTNEYHNTKIEHEIASATAIREALENNLDVSKQLPYDFTYITHTLSMYYPFVQLILLTHSRDDLASILLVDEGIEGLFQKEAYQNDMNTFISTCTSRRYTASRIKRTLIHLMLQTKKEDVPNIHELAHIRVLGFNNVGQSYLKVLREKEDVEVVTMLSKLPDYYRLYEMKATQVYAYPLSIKEKEDLRKKELGGPIRLIG